jgi:hypothetical protein
VDAYAEKARSVDAREEHTLLLLQQKVYELYLRAHH